MAIAWNQAVKAILPKSGWYLPKFANPANGENEMINPQNIHHK
jgi:hypothetical protein